MHELNICLSIVDTLEAQAQQHQFHHIKKLWLEIGELAGIELDALRFSFPIAASRSVADKAILDITSVEGRVQCDSCQKDVTIKTLFEPCPLCGHYGYHILQGKELRIVKMEVV